MSKHTPTVLTRSIATLAATFLATTLATPKLRAASLFWDGTGTGWDAVSSWSTAPDATTPDPAAVPGSADIATFSISTVNTAQTVNLNANQSAMGLSFLGTNTATTTLLGGGTNRTLSLGTSGITVSTGAGAVTIGSATAGQNVALSLQGAQSWTNEANSALTIVNGVSLGVAGSNTLTLSGTGTTANTISGVVANGTGTLGLNKTGTGTWVLSGANTYTGGTTVTAGTLRGTVAGSFGANTTTSAISLAGGTLELFNDTNTTFTNTNTTVTASSTISANRATSAATATTHTLGNLSIGAQTLNVTRGANITGTATGGITFGTTTLTGNATFAPGANAVLTLGGVVSGGFGLTQNGAGMTILSGANTYTGTNTITSGTLRGTVAGAFGANTTPSAISLGGGTLELFNDTGTTFTNTNTTVTANSTVIANRATSAATATTHTLGALSIGAQTLTVTRGANITGTVAGGITFGATTLTGNATLAPGANAVLTLGAVGGAFGLTQNGAGTTILSAAGTYSGGTTVTAGVLQLNNNTAAGTGAITYNSGGTGRTQINGGITISNSIIINSGVTGTASTGLLQQTGTGQATVNGSITLNGIPPSGGTFLGGNAVGNELVIGGAITGGGASQRDGRVIYRGGGSATGTLTATNTVLVGATNGLPQAWTVSLGGSGNATLDLNGFDQTLAGVQLGNAGAANNNIGTVALGGKSLTLNGDISTLSTATANVSHVINATTGGALVVGSTNRTITVNETLAIDDLAINGAAINGTGGVTKAGNGTLALNGVSVSGPLAVNAGTLQTGTFGQVGSLTSGSLSFGAGPTTLRMKVGTGGDLITTGSLTTGGTTAVNLNQLGGILSNGTYNLINYTGASPGLSGFSLAPVGHATASLVDTGTAIALSVTGNDRVIWDGTSSTAWATGATGNWKLQSTLGATDYIESDDVIFQDTPTNNAVAIAANVAPSKVSFTNTSATTYTISGNGGIAGATGLTKSGNGTVILVNPNSFTGATTISGGTLELDHDATGNVVLSGTSGVNVAAGATLKLTRNDGDFTFNRNISGAGTVVIDPHSADGTAVRNVVISGNNTGFTGLWKLSPTVIGTAGAGSFRTNPQLNPTTLGSASVDVDNQAQLWIADNTTISNNITITGTGFLETGGGTPVGLGTLTNGVYVGSGTALFGYAGIGAIRIGANDVLSGNLVVDGNAKIMAFNATGTISGTISSTSATDTLVVGGGTSGSTMIFTGTNTYGKTMVNGGSGTSTGTHLLQIGNNGNTGTLGTGEVVLYGNSAAIAELRFNRADGYTLGAGQNILGAAGVTADLARTKVIVNTTGTGLTLNGNTIDLSDGTTGGELRVAGNNGAAGINGSILNITGSSVVDTGLFFIGDQAGMSGTVNQSGTSSVTVLGQFRLGHFGTETSNYNMSGGTLNFPAAAPATFPYATANTEQAGGIYIGVDGTGNFTQSGGTITTNFVVLDNRGNTDPGANMPTGVDTYSLNGGTLILKNAQGIISRNPTVAVNLNGGTIQASGANPALDSNKITIQSGGVTLDTNGASNTFNLYGALAGTGTVNLIGGGKLATLDGTGATSTQAGGTMPGGSLGTASINIGSTSTVQANRTGVDIWSGAISGSGALTKLNTGTLTLSGNSSGYTGVTTVSAGRLNLVGSFGASAVNVADGASLGGESTLAAVTLGTTTGANVSFDPNTAGALSATNLTVNGATTVDFDTVPTGAGPYTALNYTTKSGAGTIGLANAANYRVLPAVVDNGSSITVDVTGTKALTWTGTGGATWNINTTSNWNDATLAADKFFAGDTVTFGDDIVPPPAAVTVTSGVSPWKTTVNSNTNNYTLTSTANGISGPGSIEKSGTSTLTLAGPNTYSGKTVISGGTIAISAANSLGNGAQTNTISLSGGGRLNYTGATAIDLGATRNIDVGTGGGTIAHSGTTNVTMAIPGNLTGAGSLKFSTTGTSGTASTVTTYSLSGSNSGYTGDITVEATNNILSTLALTSQASVPNAASITLFHPAAATAANNATTLALSGVSLPAGTILKLNAFLTAGSVSQRSQVTSTGISAINGPINLTGNAGSTIQFAPPSGNLTINGNITETTPGSFGTAATLATVFFRAAGETIINGTINLPNALISRVDDNGTTTINSTGNIWAATDVRSASTLRLGATNALPIGATLTIGQATDGSASVFEMNGFSQTVNGLISIAGNANNLRRVTNSSTTLSTLTIDSSTDRTFGNIGTNTGGNITGNIAIVKNGSSTQTFAGPANTYTGNVTVNGGTLVAGGNTASNALGSPTTAGRVVTVNSGATIRFDTNNVFGNGIGNSNLPSIVLNGGTLNSLRYNVLGNLTLNGATLTQTSTDAGNFEGLQFRGDVTVGGSSASTIATTNGKANHLGANTTFNVANATGDSATDLTVSAPLRNQSGDFGSAAGGFTKVGNGTLELLANNTYTGETIVNEGTLEVTGSISASTVTVNGGTLTGTGTLGPVILNPLSTLAPGASPGTLTLTDVTFAGGTFALEVNGTGLGQADQLVASGSVSLTSNTPITLSLGYDPVDGVDSFVVINKTSAGPISTAGGLFSFGGTPLTEGAIFAVSGQSFSFSYQGGDGNDVVVAAVPEPGSFAALLGGCGILLGLQRARRRR